MKRLFSIMFATVLLAGGFALPAQAELRRMSPADVAAGTFPFPMWIEDANGVRIAPCTDLAVCLEGIAIPAFPDPLFEVIYFGAEKIADVGVGADGLGPARVRIIMAIEAFPDEVDPTVPVLSNGILVRIDNALPGDYRVTLPYDVDHDDDPATPKVAEFTLTPDPQSNRVLGVFPAEVLVAATLPTSITDALTGPIDTFLLPSASEGGAPLAPVTVGTGRFLFDGGVLEAETFVTGSPTGRNFARIIGPAGFGTVTFNQFGLFGQLPDIHDRRAELSTRNGKIQVSGTSNLAAVPAGTTLTITTEEAVPQALGTTLTRADGSFSFTTRAPRLLPVPGGAVGREVKALRIDSGVAGPVTVTPLVIR
jgi:hypothetical protein